MVTTIAKPALPPRALRHPKHPFKIEHRPWSLVPFLCAPVLPGETMTNLLLQSRVVSDPIKDPLAGWWLEYYFFYVKFNDMDQRDTLMTMIIDPNSANVASLRAGAHLPRYNTAKGGINWVAMCMKPVVEHYFRDEGVVWNANDVDSMPVVAVAERNADWMQSLTLQDVLTPDDVTISVAGDDAFTMSELENARRQYELLKAHGLTKLTWDGYLEQAGVRPTLAEGQLHRPELLRYTREWTYPTNTIDPTNGTPRSAVSWAIAERADKNRMFAEPGFILGLTTARPKVYYENQVGLAAGMLDSAAMWLPPMLQDDSWSSLTKHVVSAGSGPLPFITDADGYVWDARDLFLYGEQFINFAPEGVTGRSLVDLPTASGQRDFPDSDDMNEKFVSPTVNKIRHDGIVHLTIKGRVWDTTPQYTPPTA